MKKLIREKIYLKRQSNKQKLFNKASIFRKKLEISEVFVELNLDNIDLEMLRGILLDAKNAMIIRPGVMDRWKKMGKNNQDAEIKM
jgi:hypothetical protein